jgi:hypothetical protein
MIRFHPESRRRSIIPLLGAGLAAVYLFVFAPLSREAESLDQPLEQAWRKLAATLGQTNAVRLDFVAITNQLAETRQAIAVLETARKQAQRRVDPGEPVRARMSETFQLVEYDNEVGRRMGDLARLAKQQKVVIEPAVFAGFPEQTAEVTEPTLLWAELAFIDCLLTSAINCQVATIHSLSAPLLLTNPPPANGVRTLAELPVQLELTGPAPSVARFLQSLPLRGEELKAAGLPDAPTNKPALFVDRLVLRKQSPDKRDEVRLSLRAVGFVFRE